MAGEKYIISEFENISQDIDIIREKSELNGEEKKQKIFLTGCLQKANKLNRNGRVYPLEILKREGKKYLEELVDEGRALGELDHPDSAVVNLSSASHKVVDMWWQGDELYGRIQVLNTPSGEILKGLLESDVLVGISSRGVGSVQKKGGNDHVQDDFELIAFDIVSSPSTPGSYMYQESVNSRGLTKLNDQKVIKPNDEEFYEINKDAIEQLNKLYNGDFWKKI